ncbi:hypothetical protein BD780_002434 [Clostridium tetanomorphum]|nr:hypothetical protein [Clostridium tetanomorphum]NRS85209.1 hypothetical protein [Clostridium tetanomorphum]NRZ98388.1 hypothetical protein [Clostridium tetanomorphum]SQC03082.1 Uncharacterised protein [Clostridium tetanomorphum]
MRRRMMRRNSIRRTVNDITDSIEKGVKRIMKNIRRSF